MAYHNRSALVTAGALRVRLRRQIQALSQLIDDAESYAENRGVPSPIDTAELRRDRSLFDRALQDLDEAEACRGSSNT